MESGHPTSEKEIQPQRSPVPKSLWPCNCCPNKLKGGRPEAAQSAWTGEMKFWGCFTLIAYLFKKMETWLGWSVAAGDACLSCGLASTLQNAVNEIREKGGKFTGGQNRGVLKVKLSYVCSSEIGNA